MVRPRRPGSLTYLLTKALDLLTYLGETKTTRLTYLLTYLGETKTTRLVRPYVMDLGSTNGTYVNGDRVEAQR